MGDSPKSYGPRTPVGQAIIEGRPSFEAFITARLASALERSYSPLLFSGSNGIFSSIVVPSGGSIRAWMELVYTSLPTPFLLQASITFLVPSKLTFRINFLLPGIIDITPARW